MAELATDAMERTRPLNQAARVGQVVSSMLYQLKELEMTAAMRAAWFSDQSTGMGGKEGGEAGRTVTPVVFILVISLSMNVFTNLVRNSGSVSFSISMRILRDQSRGTRSEKTLFRPIPMEVSTVHGIERLLGRGLDFSTSPLVFVIVVGRVGCCAFDMV